ncbi:MAG: hypothetical protein NUW21_08790, partial [Elusimicrobia bacterium]|nr:hypothetical protein [Elusimicrobiota bacterium]
MKPLIAAVLLLPLVSAAAAAETKPWKNAVELSFVNANGNSKTQTTSAKNVFVYDLDAKTKAEVEAGGLGARGEGR